MVKLYTDRRMLDHVTPHRHPERPERLLAIQRQLDRSGLRKTCENGKVREATNEELTRVHSAGYLAQLLEFERTGGGLAEADTWVGPGSLQAARVAAGAAIEAVSHVLGGTHRRAMCLVRPPGHHALADEPMGFCIFNNIAVAAAESVARYELDRVLIVDFDVHHGNGTQDIFYTDPCVAFLSIHRFPFYPGTGLARETGSGKGQGLTLNIPLPFGISRTEYRAAFRSGLEVMADRTRPQLVLISAGFDAHAEDPVGSLGLDTEDFEDLTRRIVDVAETHADGRIVSVLEGGYNLSRLAGCVEAHLLALGAEPIIRT
ncbi:MAG: histone deacetylase [Planctomycetaceae bacterium]|nr:histone deacetylase [Planctomycetaceae bacterium]